MRAAGLLSVLVVCGAAAALGAVVSAQGRSYDATGVWIGPGCPEEAGPCDPIVVELSQKGNKVTGTLGDLAAFGFQADFDFRRLGAPWRGNYDFTLTIFASDGACSPAVFTGAAHIDTETSVLTAAASGINTDCLPELNEFVLEKQL
jgi:hypothetical protein